MYFDCSAHSAFGCASYHSSGLFVSLNVNSFLNHMPSLSEFTQHPTRCNANG